MEESGFTLPESILSQLNEFSYGGFLVFSFDDGGAPRFYAQFDNELNMMALQKAAEYWLQGVHDINSRNIKDQLSGPVNPSQTEEQEEEQEEEGWHDIDEDDDNLSA